MEQDYLNKIIEENPNVDRTAIDRSHQAAKQLADVGIRLGGYNLTPALGGAIFKHSDDFSRQDSLSAQSKL